MLKTHVAPLLARATGFLTVAPVAGIPLCAFCVVMLTIPAATLAMAADSPPGPRDYVLFESGPVRPVALTPDGERLLVTNIPDGTLEVLAVTAFGLTPLQSVPVGMEPVAVAVTGDGSQAWVVNHVSDSVTIVDLSSDRARVVNTLWVGDEPRDIVFAGTERELAFITTAHRGQRSPIDPQLLTPGVGRADVFVFDVEAPGPVPGGSPLSVLTLFGDTPRALAVSPDGRRVFAAVFHSGNRTTTLPPPAARPFNKAPPTSSADGVAQPNTGLIVRFDGRTWSDELGQSWNSRVSFQLSDLDVFEIDATTNPPRELRSFAGVGTTLFNMVVDPADGTLLVSNTDARNHVRFAGIANRAETTVRGNLADNRITTIAPDGVVRAHALNPHLDFDQLSVGLEERQLSISTPTAMAIDSRSGALYLAAFGSAKVVRLDRAALTGGTYVPSALTQARLSGGGPAGLVLDPGGERLFVYTRFDNAISIVSLDRFEEVDHIALHNPEPETIRHGRPFLYDAELTSGLGNDSCATCHVFGNVDALAWDLGDPEGSVQPILNAYHPLTANNPGLGFTFHPMKGPMTTQSMRGLRRHGPMHWRGDRTGALAAPDETLERAAFKEFNEAFLGLMARAEELAPEEMEQFTDFALELTYPPNPNRNLDNSLTPQQSFGRELYNQGVIRSNGVLEICVQCHPVDPAAGLFGTQGQMAFNNQPGEKDFKIPHFRDQYQKIGSFSASMSNPFISGPQIRGFGFNHNGATHTSNILDDLGLPAQQFDALRQYLFAFPTETAPVVGQQVTISSASPASADAEYRLLRRRADVTTPVPECDLVAHGVVGGQPRAWLWTNGAFEPDNGGESESEPQLLSRARFGQNHITFQCVPWGSGQRIALDRDGDGVANGVEATQGSNPLNASDASLRPSPGLWYDPSRVGAGFDLAIVGNQLVVTWYTYDQNGAPVWYQAVGAVGRHFEAILNGFRWDFADRTATPQQVGLLSIDFADATRATLRWQLGDDQGARNLQRLVFDNHLTALPFTGLWFDPTEPGWGLSLDAAGDTLVSVLFYYRSDGTPSWSIGTAGNDITASTPMLGFSGPCPACPFEPAVQADAGSATFAFHSLQNATLALDADAADARWLRDTEIRKLQ